MTYYFLLCKDCNVAAHPYTDDAIALQDLISHTGRFGHECEIKECHPNWEPSEDTEIIDEPGMVEILFERFKE